MKNLIHFESRHGIETDLVLQTTQNIVEYTIPVLKHFGKVPRCRLESSDFGRVKGVEGSDEGSDDGLVVFDEQSLEGK